MLIERLKNSTRILASNSNTHIEYKFGQLQSKTLKLLKFLYKMGIYFSGYDVISKL